MPEKGASTVIYDARSSPAKRPVYRAKRRELVVNNTISISPNEIIVSAMKATIAPSGLGTVAI
jgi:hypothetical protein